MAINPTILNLLLQAAQNGAGSPDMGGAPSGLDPSGLGLLGTPDAASGPPDPPAYAAPAVAMAPRPGFLDRAAVGLAQTPGYAPTPYASGAQAGVSGLLSGLAGGYGRARLLDMGTRQKNEAARVEASKTAADRNYANQLETWKLRYKKYLDDSGNVVVGPELINRYPSLAPLKGKGVPMERFMTYVGQTDTRASSEAQRKIENDRAAASLSETARHNKVMESRSSTSGALGQPGVDDIANNIADAIESGLQPPDIKGLYRYGGPVRAALAARKYDLKGANTDWQAVQRWVATANGTQQTRMRQAANTAYESLDVVDQLSAQLSKQIPRGKVKVFNRAALIAAQNGAFGPEAQSTATNLQAQITDIVSELGNVYMGGNSPTDHALSLAKQNLSADWSEKQLHDAVGLARTNLRIRLNSIQNVTPIAPDRGGDPWAKYGRTP